MTSLRGPLTIPDEKRVLSPSERLPFHCSRVLQEHWLRFGCDQEAVVIYELPDGARAGFCVKHRRDAEVHAKARDWKVAA